MSFTFTLTQDRNTFRTDERTNTIYQLPTVTSKDLTGCGTGGYVNFSNALTINYRAGCSKSVPALSLSVKSLKKVDPTAMSYSKYFDDLIKAIAPWIWGLSTDLVDESQISLVASGNVPFASTMKDLISDGTPNGNSKIILSIPTTKFLYDKCQPSLLIGRNASLSVSEQVFDSVSCKATLGESISISISVYDTAVYSATSSAPIPWGITTATDGANAIITQTRENSYFNTPLFDPTNSLAVNQNAVLTIFRNDPVQNVPVTMGV